MIMTIPFGMSGTSRFKDLPPEIFFQLFPFQDIFFQCEANPRFLKRNMETQNLVFVHWKKDSNLGKRYVGTKAGWKRKDTTTETV